MKNFTFEYYLSKFYCYSYVYHEIVWMRLLCHMAVILQSLKISCLVWYAARLVDDSWKFWLHLSANWSNVSSFWSCVCQLHRCVQSHWKSSQWFFAIEVRMEICHYWITIILLANLSMRVFLVDLAGIKIKIMKFDKKLR